MDIAVELVKLVSRSFYDDKYSVFLDLLLREKMLSDDVLADRMQLLMKDINKIAAKLREDRLVKVEIKQETREYDDRPISRIYYYVDIPHFVDVVKYRLYRMRQALEERAKNEANEKGYYCAQCKKMYSTLDVSKLVNPITFVFECEVCKNELQSIDTSMLSADSKSQSKLFEQTNDILRLLKKLDNAILSRFDPIEYLRNNDKPLESIPLENSSSSSLTSLKELPIDGMSKPSPELGVAGGSSLSKPLEVEIREGAGAFRNEMPLWHTHSTITGQLVRSSVKEKEDNKISRMNATTDEHSLDYIKYYESINNGSVGKKVKCDVTATETMQETASATAVLIAVQGILKDIVTITDEDKNNMTEEEYQKYYEAFMNLEN